MARKSTPKQSDKETAATPAPKPAKARKRAASAPSSPKAAQPPKPVTAPKAVAAPKAATAKKAAPTHAEIAARARLLWEQKGCPQGRDTEIWLEAEQQLRG